MRRLGVIASSVPPANPPALRDYTTVYDFFASPFSLPRPNYAAGDLMLAVIVSNRDSEFDGTFFPPSGWASAFAFNYVGPFGDPIQVVGFYKFAGPSEPSSYSFTHSLFSAKVAASIMSFSDAAGLHGTAAIEDFYEFSVSETQLAPGPTSGSSSDPIRVDIYAAMGFFEFETKYNISTYTGNVDQDYNILTFSGVVHFIFDGSGSLAPTAMNFQSIADASGIGVSFLVTSKY